MGANKLFFLPIPLLLLIQPISCDESPKPLPVIYHHSRAEELQLSFISEKLRIVVTVSPSENTEPLQAPELNDFQVYEGTVEGSEESYAAGTVLNDLFSGFVRLANGDTFIIQDNPTKMNQTIAYRATSLDDTMYSENSPAMRSFDDATEILAQSNESLYCMVNVLVDFRVMENIVDSYGIKGAEAEQRKVAEKIFLRDLLATFLTTNRILQPYSFNDTKIALIINRVQLFQRSECEDPIRYIQNPFCADTYDMNYFLEKVLTKHSTNSSCATVAFIGGNSILASTLGIA